MPTPSRDEIVLKAANATRLGGAIRLITKAEAATGQVLEVGQSQKSGIEVYPAHTDTGRKTTGTSQFVLQLDPKNHGVLLRRKLDYALPNQRAEVFIAHGNEPAAEADWKPAGIWYLAGANTCVYSNPKEELGATVHTVQTSNRRFRDDEFLVPKDLTVGKKSIQVRLKFTPVQRPLFPGHPLPELGWSELRYDVYCFVMPSWKP